VPDRSSRCCTRAGLAWGTFQHHFVCRLDQDAGILHLIPNDRLASEGQPVSVVSPAKPDESPSRGVSPASPATPDKKPSRELSPVSAGRPIDLLPLVNNKRDAIEGAWTTDSSGALKTDGKSNARLMIPYEPPEEYDFLVEFVRLGGRDQVFQIFPASNSALVWEMGSHGTQDDARRNRRNLTRTDDPVLHRPRQALHLAGQSSVRDGIEVLLNGNRVAEYKGRWPTCKHRTSMRYQTLRRWVSDRGVMCQPRSRSCNLCP